EGERLLARCRPLLLELREVKNELQAGRSVISGELSISMPSHLGRHAILPWLDDFHLQHPDLSLRVQLSDRLADVQREPVDVAIRYGKPADSGMVALPLAADNRRLLCAAPPYLERCSAPAHPVDLAQHNCLCFRLGDHTYNRW